jgi:hypothetical protein
MAPLGEINVELDRQPGKPFQEAGIPKLLDGFLSES